MSIVGKGDLRMKELHSIDSKDVIVNVANDADAVKQARDDGVEKGFLEVRKRSEELFHQLSIIPMYGGRHAWKPYFLETFECFTKVWQLQQKHRSLLLRRKAISNRAAIVTISVMVVVRNWIMGKNSNVVNIKSKEAPTINVANAACFLLRDCYDCTHGIAPRCCYCVDQKQLIPLRRTLPLSVQANL
eukprot:m.28151 g.28151  ORF g.28151 m.28151 type:complete len:188 (-) comp6021_c0_seq1:178-741(-)